MLTAELSHEKPRNKGGTFAETIPDGIVKLLNELIALQAMPGRLNKLRFISLRFSGLRNLQHNARFPLHSALLYSARKWYIQFKHPIYKHEL